MREITLSGSNRVNIKWCVGFLQMMVDRLIVGHHRYGFPQTSQQYFKRLQGAVEHYKKTGNKEFLVDAANYAILEYEFSSHPNAHFKSNDSQGRNLTSK